MKIERRTGVGDEQKSESAYLPDTSGSYDTLIGQITIDLTRLIPDRTIVLEGEVLRGREDRKTKEGKREVTVSWRGTATEQLGPDDYLDINVGRKLGKSPARIRKERRGQTRGKRFIW